MNTQYDSSTGWWPDKPEPSAAGAPFWRLGGWVLALAAALVCTLVEAARL